MKSLMKLFVLSLVVLLGTTAAFAQRKNKEKANPEERAERQTSHMVETLSLSADQAEKVAAINLEFANNVELDKKERKAAHKEALGAVLTDEQLATWAEVRKNRKGKKGGKKGKAKGMSLKNNLTPAQRAEKMTQKMTEAANLTDQQIAEVTKINEDFAAQMASAKANSEDRAAAKEQMKSLKKDHRTALKSVLSPAQMDQLKATKKNCKGACKKKSKTSKL